MPNINPQAPSGSAANPVQIGTDTGTLPAGANAGTIGANPSPQVIARPQATVQATPQGAPTQGDSETLKLLPSSAFSDNPNYKGPASATVNTENTGNNANPKLLPLSAFSDNPNYKGSETNEITINPEDSLPTKIAKTGAGIGEGIGEGVLAPVAGLADIADKIANIPPGKITQYLHDLAGDNIVQHGTAQAIGRPIGGILDFMLADNAAMAGMSYAEKLATSAKAIQTLEKFPVLSTAMKLGVGLSKVVGEVSPEESDFIQAHPVIAKLVSIAKAALSSENLKAAAAAGIAQGGLTTAETGGNLKSGAESGLAMGALSGGVGGVVKGITAAAKGGAEAAKTAQELTEQAKAAPTEGEVGKALETKALEATNPQKLAAENEKAENIKDIGKLAEGAPSKEQVTRNAQEMAVNADNEHKAAYTVAENGIRRALEGETLDFEGSPMQKVADDLTKTGKSNDPVEAAANKSRPGSPRVNDMLEALSQIGKPGEDGAAKGGFTDLLKGFFDNPAMSDEDKTAASELENDKEPHILDINKLLSYRKMFGEMLRNTGDATDEQRSDRRIYRKIIGSVDDSISSLAENTKNPGIINTVGNMNRAYFKYSRLYENRDVQNILKGNIGDVFGKIMRGETAPADIDNVKEFLGEKRFDTFALDGLRRFAADHVKNGNIDYESLTKDWNKMDPQKLGTREKVFGQFSKDTFDRVLNTISGNDKKLAEINDTVSSLMAGSGVDNLLKNPEKIDEIGGTIGEKGLKEISRMALANKIKEASTQLGKNGKITYRFDPGKFLGWVDSLKDNPEGVNKLFKIDKGSEEAYNKLLSNATNLMNVRKINKYILATGITGAAGAVGMREGGLSGGVIGLLGTMAAGSAAGFKDASLTLDALANDPKIWKAYGWVGRAIAKTAASPTAQALKLAGTKAVYNGVSDVLGGPGNDEERIENYNKNKTIKNTESLDNTYDSGPLVGSTIPGLIKKGNIDVNHRPDIKNDDGSHSTIFSMTIPVNKNGEIWKGSYENSPAYALVPSIVNGKFLTPDGKKPKDGDKKALSNLEDAATAYYNKTRQNLGVFSSSRAADNYAEKSHSYGNDGSEKKVYMPSTKE